jgi:hypothetical protein
MVESNEFTIGGIDLHTPVIIENFKIQSRQLELDLYLRGDLANSKEVNLEDQAESAGNVVQLMPTGSPVIWQDLGSGTPNTVEVAIGEDFIFNQSTPFHANCMWLNYEAEHFPGMPDLVRIIARLGIIEEL